jgi:hypothetical protein
MKVKFASKVFALLGISIVTSTALAQVVTLQDVQRNVNPVQLACRTQALVSLMASGRLVFNAVDLGSVRIRIGRNIVGGDPWATNDVAREALSQCRSKIAAALELFRDEIDAALHELKDHCDSGTPSCIPDSCHNSLNEVACTGPATPILGAEGESCRVSNGLTFLTIALRLKSQVVARSEGQEKDGGYLYQKYSCSLPALASLDAVAKGTSTYACIPGCGGIS